MEQHNARRRAAKLPVGPRLDQRVNAAELPLCLRTVNLAAIAARSEKFAANKASMLRNETRRIEQLMNGRVTHHASIGAAAMRVQKEVDDLAKAVQKTKLNVIA